MDKLGKKLVRNIKSRRYEVMEGVNTPERIETLQVDRLSPDSGHQLNNNGYSDSQSNRGGFNFDTASSKKSKSSYKVREPGADLEMTAAVSGVVPDGRATY